MAKCFEKKGFIFKCKIDQIAKILKIFTKVLKPQILNIYVYMNMNYVAMSCPIFELIELNVM